MFKLYLTTYPVWRLLVDGIEPVPFDYRAFIERLASSAPGIGVYLQSTRCAATCSVHCTART